MNAPLRGVIRAGEELLYVTVTELCSSLSGHAHMPEVLSDGEEKRETVRSRQEKEGRSERTRVCVCGGESSLVQQVQTGYEECALICRSFLFCPDQVSLKNTCICTIKRHQKPSIRYLL